MFYRYNKKELRFEKVKGFKVFQFGIISIALMSFISISTMELVDYEKILEINIMGDREFTEDKLVRKLKELNVKYPHIVLAQAMLESNQYSSHIFIDNNNLFGMKEARVRIHTAKGTQHKHAYYNTWQESVLDYAFWAATYGSKCKTEQQYFNLLSGYAEDGGYEAKLKNMINKHQLKLKFN